MNINELESFMKDLEKSGLTISFAESMTAGKLVNEFSKVDGASKVLKGSIVTYHPELKVQLLNVDPVSISEFTPESQEVTTEMVKGLAKLISSNICIAVTGLASEGGSESPEKPVGTVFISILFDNKLYEFREVFNADNEKKNSELKNEIMDKTVDFIFYKLKELYEKSK